ncbi:MAG: pirin-like C-terminal cupin domain-containing protein, partial [Desulfobacteraceae bacterium]
VVIDPEYLDITVPPKSSFRHSVKRRHKAFAYVIEGEGHFGQGMNANARKMVGPENLVIFDDGDQVAISSEDKPVRALFVSGRPIGEPVAWHGPIVMNTREELRMAFEEYEKGKFIKS